MCSTLNLLPLPTPALPGSGACFLVTSDEWWVMSFYQLTGTQNLKLNTQNFKKQWVWSQPVFQFGEYAAAYLSFQSKAPLENYGAKVFFYFEFFTIVDFKGAQEAARFGCSISDLLYLAKARVCFVCPLSVGWNQRQWFKMLGYIHSVPFMGRNMGINRRL